MSLENGVKLLDTNPAQELCISYCSLHMSTIAAFKCSCRDETGTLNGGYACLTAIKRSVEQIILLTEAWFINMLNSPPKDLSSVQFLEKIRSI